MKSRYLTFTLILVIALAVAFFYLRPHTFHGTVIQSPDPSFNFTLTSADGDISLSDYRGKLVLVYFGYTFCPDICPATLANVGQALRSIGPKAEDIQVIMVSLDPERDTPEKLDKYVHQFYPTYIGVTGTKEQLDEVASLYGIFYEKDTSSSEENYGINHTASLLVLDREGYLKLVFPFGVTVPEIADDLKYMLRQ